MKKYRCYVWLLTIGMLIVIFSAWQWGTIGIWMSMRANWGIDLPLLIHAKESHSTQGFGGDGELCAVITYCGEVSLKDWNCYSSNDEEQRFMQTYGTKQLDEVSFEKINNSLENSAPDFLKSVSYSEWLQIEKYYICNDSIRDYCYILNDTEKRKLYIVMNFM